MPLVLPFLLLAVLTACVSTPLSPEKKKAEFSQVPPALLLNTFKNVLKEEGYTLVEFKPALGELAARLESDSLTGDLEMFGVGPGQNYPTGSRYDVKVRIVGQQGGHAEAFVDMVFTALYARRTVNESGPSQIPVDDAKPYARLFERVRMALKPERLVRPH